jgi:hypothetical protein
MNRCTPWASRLRLRESIGAGVDDDERDRLACVDALLRATAAHDRQETPTHTACHPRTRSHSELRPYRPIHSGAEPQIGQVLRPGGREDGMA